MNAFFGSLLEILVVLILVAANGFFVAAEFALVKIRASQLKPMARAGNWRVKFALLATGKLDAALSATQLGITLASLGLGWVGEPFVAHRIAPLLSALGVTHPATVASISFTTAFILITFLHIILGELAPKSLAIQRPKTVSLFTAAPLMFFYHVFFPVIWLLNTAANRLIRLAGIAPASEGEHAFSREELEYVLGHARHTHPGDAMINKLMIRSLRLRELQAQQIMRPREQIAALWLDKSDDENLRVAQTSGYSRYPVCRDSLDNVVGILFVREWLWQLQLLGPGIPWEPLIRPALTFTLKTPTHAMLELFRTSRNHLAIVLDDNGVTAGIVAFEDLLEEIVGDIRDEFDIEAGPIFESGEQHIVVSGSLTMRELQAETGWTFEWENPKQTVAHWAEQQFGQVPRRDEKVTVGEYTLTALDVHAERIRRVKVQRDAPPKSNPPA
ncbi:MAG: hemolysin family protein [Opitutaceae bacterium]|jgi:CBS domain containing-hemolysin-like protein|nr:hemolysin family protein [Opitutaceae bacterium]